MESATARARALSAVVTTVALTAVHSAATHGQVEALRALQQLGCRMEAQDAEGMTAVHHAAVRGQVEALRALQQLGCPLGSDQATRKTQGVVRRRHPHAERVGRQEAR